MKKRTGLLRRLGALAVAAVMTLQLAGCGEDEPADSVSTAAEWVWVPEYVTVGVENFSYYDTVLDGSSLCTILYDYDEAAGTSTQTLGRYSLEDGSFTKTPIQWEGPKDGGWNVRSYVLTEDGGMTALLSVTSYGDFGGLGDDMSADEAAGAEDGTAAGDSAGAEDGTAAGEAAGGENSSGAESFITDYKQTVYLARFDKEGKNIFSQDITEQVQGDPEFGFYVSSLALDEKGRIYISAESGILLYDEEGSYKGTVPTTTVNAEALGQGRDGKVYFCGYSREAATMSYVLTEVDFDGVKAGAVYKDFPGARGEKLTMGKEKDFLAFDGEAMYEYDLASQTKEELFRWLDSDINGNYVRSVGVLEDGRVLAVVEDWEDTSNSGIVLLTKTAADQVPQKETIVVATLSGGYNLKALIVNFNRNSDKYHVTVKEYLNTDNWDGNDYVSLVSDAVTSLNNDITSGNCPDIIDLSGLNFKQLASKGAFEDLNGYLEDSAVLDRSQFLENILEAYSYNGSLISIPASVALQTVAGKAEDVGAQMGWTLEEMIAYAEAHPDAAMFEGATKQQILYYLLNSNEDAFVDWETGKCNFNSDEFKHLLEFVKSFPDEYDYASDNTSTATKIQKGQVLMETVYISDFKDIQIYPELFGGEVTYIGFPTADRRSGCKLSSSQALAITSKSKVKEGAWEFIESCLLKDQGSRFNSSGFPVMKDRLQALAEEAVKVEYLTDENGELILDSEGNAIAMGGSSTVFYEDGWSYTYRQATQEEVDIIMHLLEVAEPAPDLYGSNVSTIVTEEAEAFFKGQKSVEETVSVIQSRVELYVSEGN